MSIERQCTLLLPNEHTIAADGAELAEQLMSSDETVIADALKKVIQLMLNGEQMPGMLMNIIRFCVPKDDHLIKKLVYIYLETVDKTGPDGKMREEMILVCNFLRRDLSHANEFVRGCALRFVSKIKEAEILEPLIEPVRSNLEHRHSYVRRNAVLAIFNAYKVSANLVLDAPELVENFLSQESDVSACRNALMMLISCDMDRAIAYVANNADDIVSMGDIIQVQVLELIRKVCRQDPSQKSRFMGIIFEMLSSESSSVTFECASTLANLSSSTTALKAAAQSLLDLVNNHPDNNVRLVALSRVNEMRAKHPSVVQSMVLDLCRALHSPSEDIREMALNMVVELTTGPSVDSVVGSLKKMLSSGTTEEGSNNALFRSKLVHSIHQIMLSFPKSTESVLPVLLDLVIDDDSAVASEVVTVIREALVTHPELQDLIRERLRESLPSAKHDSVIKAVVWILMENSDAEESLVQSLDAVFECISPLPIHADSANEDSNPDSSRPNQSEGSGRVTVLADGTYASQADNVAAPETATSSADSASILRSKIVSGQHHVGVAIVSAVSKGIIKLRQVVGDDAPLVSKFSVMTTLLATSIIRLARNLKKNSIDRDAVERICSMVTAASEAISGESLKGWLQTAQDAFGKTVQARIEAARKQEAAAEVSIMQPDEPLLFRQLTGSLAGKMLADEDGADLSLATGASADSDDDFAQRLDRVQPLTGFGDPVYVEAIVTCHDYDVVLDTLVINRTGNTLKNVTLDVATVGDLRIVERPQPFTLGPHKSRQSRIAVKVASVENGIIYGSVNYEDDSQSGRHGKASEGMSINLSDVHLDIMQYIQPASCDETHFRKMWAEFEWENKIIVNTPITDTLEFLNHVISATNMRCLTDRAHLRPNGRFLAANLHARSIFGEDALLNIAVEKTIRGKIEGNMRIRAKSQGMALSLGDKISLKQKENPANSK